MSACACVFFSENSPLGCYKNIHYECSKFGCHHSTIRAPHINTIVCFCFFLGPHWKNILLNLYMQPYSHLLHSLTEPHAVFTPLCSLTEPCAVFIILHSLTTPCCRDRQTDEIKFNLNYYPRIPSRHAGGHLVQLHKTVAWGEKCSLLLCSQFFGFQTGSVGLKKLQTGAYRGANKMVIVNSASEILYYVDL